MRSRRGPVAGWGLGALLLVLGLLGMHGLAQAASGGCHGQASTGMSMLAHHSTAVSATGHDLPQAVVPHGTAADGALTGQAGALCQAVLPDPAAPLAPPALAVLALVLVLVSAYLPSAPVRTLWCGPPRSGAAILLRVCVSRT